MGKIAKREKRRFFQRTRFFQPFKPVSATAIGLVLVNSTQSYAAPLFSNFGSGALDRTSVLLLAIFGGAVSFAMLSAFWLIRERARIGTENDKLRTNFAGVRAERDRLSALAEVDDQRIVVWGDESSENKVLGSLDPECGAPVAAGDFLKFGSWLKPASSAHLERAVEDLRQEAKQFTLSLTTNKERSVEAQGRVSGGHAFVRFILLEGARQELARIDVENNKLINRFELLENLFEKFPTPVWIRNEAGQLAYANSAYAHAVETDNRDVAVAENKALFDRKEREAIDAALAQENFCHSNLPVVVAGDRRMMETVHVSGSGGSAGIAVDRADVESVRATLKHAIASHQQTFDHLATAVVIFDERQKLQFHNSSFQQLWELSPADLDGQPSNSDLLDMLRSSRKLPELPDWKRWKEQILSTYHATETREEHWHLPDGRTLRVIINPQNHGGASWVFENVTEELALKSNYNSLMRVQGETLDHLNEAVAVFGSDGRVRLTNPAFLSLWGFKEPQDVEGRHVRDITKTVIEQIAEKETWEKISLGITGVDDDRTDIAGRIEITAGSIYDYHLVYLPEGQSMLTLADMTAAVNIERALKDRNDALEESDVLKNRFIQHVSYELRAPLTSIAGFAEILATDGPGKLNTKQSEYLEYISSSSDVLKALIDDILDLATIDAGAMQLDLGKVAIQDAVDESLEAVSDKLERFQIKVETNIAANANEVVGDADRLRQIIYNLLSNAVAVSPDGGKISIDAKRNQDQLELSISDQGPGVAPENRESVFERFETVKGKDRRRGAGLGLSIVKSFVELHGGTVRVENSKWDGACFICSIPLEQVTALQAAE